MMDGWMDGWIQKVSFCLFFVDRDQPVGRGTTLLWRTMMF
jgi:hypothetical protein